MPDHTGQMHGTGIRDRYTGQVYGTGIRVLNSSRQLHYALLPFSQERSLRNTIFSREHEILLWHLQRARRDSGLTQRQLAERLGRTQTWVSQCESGERREDYLELGAICQAIGISFTQLADRVEADLERESL